MLFIRLSTLLLGALLSVQTHARQSVSIDLGAGLTATAGYHPGAPGAPAVILLHGFLQTNQFPTVRSLGAALADEGMSVLLPTLSLGLDRRRQSLPCEAIHLHAMQDDVRELGLWVDWLHRRTGRRVDLLGHSAGSIQVVAYLAARPAAQVRRVGLISLTYFGDQRSGHASPEQAGIAELAMQTGDDALRPYGLSFCNGYVTTPERYLSYYRWSGETLLEAIRRIERPLTVIYGSRDDRVDEEWLSELRAAGVRLRPVQGANHFFDRTHEFELLQEVERLLE